MATVGNHESGKVSRFVEDNYSSELKNLFENLLKLNENARKLNEAYAQKPVTELYNRAVELSKKIKEKHYTRDDLVIYCACLNNIQAKTLISLKGAEPEKTPPSTTEENLPTDEDFNKETVSL